MERDSIADGENQSTHDSISIFDRVPELSMTRRKRFSCRGIMENCRKETSLAYAVVLKETENLVCVIH